MKFAQENELISEPFMIL